MPKIDYTAKVVALLAQSVEYIQAGVFLHPSFVTEDDIKGKFVLTYNTL